MAVRIEVSHYEWHARASLQRGRQCEGSITVSRVDLHAASVLVCRAGVHHDIWDVIAVEIPDSHFLGHRHRIAHGGQILKCPVSIAKPDSDAAVEIGEGEVQFSV